MTPERFALCTTSSWKGYGIFLALCAGIIVSVPLIGGPTLENFAAGLGGLVLFAAIFTPVLFIATRPGGNWVELREDRLRIKHWWISGLDVSYSDITGITERSRHNPILVSLTSKSMAPFEPHVDLLVRLEGFRRQWRMGRWAYFGGAIHVSTTDPGSFVAALRRRLELPVS